MSGRWQNSTRKQRLPPNWQTLRGQVLARDLHKCQWRDPELPTLGAGAGAQLPICGAPANQVDHIHTQGGDVLSNLRALCARHHALRSSTQGNTALAAKRGTLKRTEPHPGRI